MALSAKRYRKANSSTRTLPSPVVIWYRVLQLLVR